MKRVTSYLSNLHHPKLAASLLLLSLLSPCTHASFAQEIAIIGNADNNTQLTQAEAINIFMGRYRQFSNGTSAKPIDNEALKQEFYLALVNKSSAEINAYWARLIFSGRTQPPEKIEDSNKVMDSVVKESQAISYVPLSKVDNTVKVLFVLGRK